MGWRPREGAGGALRQDRAEHQRHDRDVGRRPADPLFVPLIDECVEGATRLLCSNVKVPVNIGSDEMVSISGLAGFIADIAGKKIEINHISGPHGVRGRNSDNALINKLLGWAPSQPLRAGLERSYEWIERQAMRDDD